MSGIKLPSLLAQIAAISIAGVRVVDYDSIPTEILERDCPVLYPKPNELVSNLTVERETFGLDSNANTKKNVTYDLRYVLAYQKIGAGRNLFESYPDMVDKIFAVQEAITELDTTGGVIDITCAPVTWGVVQDPSGNAFHGCEFSFRVLEFYEV